MNESYFALFSMGAHVKGMTPSLDVKILISTFQLIQPFGCIYSILLSKIVNVSTFQSIKCTSDKICLTFGTKTLQNGIFLKIWGVCLRFLVSHCSNDISTCFSAF